jgi:cyanophycinase-like exopeptidase
MAKGVLAILGSGETAPGMTKVHRELLSRLDEVRAVNLDTPYGFQLNVPQMTQKLVDYFKVSLQTDLKPLSLTNYEDSSGVEHELFRQSVRKANYIFAGPGSPSYALAQWKGLDLQEVLLEVLDNGGIVCFSSAAALTLGAFTAPIYEIYKAGAKPFWLEGLNLMQSVGLNCAVIPHFDNNEGEGHDTSCCYLGVERLEKLEELLENDVLTLGVDEHSALLFDLDSRQVSGFGKGNSYLRHRNNIQVIRSGSSISMDELNIQTVLTTQPSKAVTSSASTPLELAKIIEYGGSEAINALADLVTLADNAIDSTNNSIQLVNTLVELRAKLKLSGDYKLADQIREALFNVKIDLKDTPNGPVWSSKR